MPWFFIFITQSSRYETVCVTEEAASSITRKRLCTKKNLVNMYRIHVQYMYAENLSYKFYYLIFNLIVKKGASAYTIAHLSFVFRAYGRARAGGLYAR